MHFPANMTGVADLNKYWLSLHSWICCDVCYVLLIKDSTRHVSKISVLSFHCYLWWWTKESPWRCYYHSALTALTAAVTRFKPSNVTGCTSWSWVKSTYTHAPCKQLYYCTMVTLILWPHLKLSPAPTRLLSQDLNAISCVKTNTMISLQLTFNLE